MKSRIQTCVAYFSSALCCSRCLCLSFLFSLSFYVCICSLFLYLPFFSSLRPPFFYLCVPLSIYREIPKKLFLALLSTDQIMEQFLSVFSSTTPNFMFNRDPLFSLFLFSLFCYFLNSFFLVRDSPLSPNRVPHFLVMISLYSLFNFSIILLLHLLLPVAIFNSLSLFIYLFRDNGRLTFWQPTFPYFFIYLGTMAGLLFGSPPSLIFFTLFP